MRLSAPAYVRIVARLALLALIFQLSALGHWSLGPIHADPGDVATHAAHCHGAVSGCAGDSSFTGSLASISLSPLPPDGAAAEASFSALMPADAFHPALTDPPRA